MKQTMTALILAVVMIVMSAACFAVEDPHVNTADALNELGLFLGTDYGYELNKGLTRAEGITLLVRMIGKEATAKNTTYKNNFTDVPEWAAGYIGYAFENGITNGTGDTTFSPNDTMTDYMFLTLVLRALDYSDKGEQPLFAWHEPYALARALNLIESETPDTKFTRADAVDIFWKALSAKFRNSDTTMADRLIEQNVFTAEELAEARVINVNGREENAGIPIIPTPETDAPETNVPEITEAHETTVAPPETTRAPETTVTPPETTRAPETTVTPPETTRAPETTVAPPETTVAPPETTRAPETTVAPPETTVAPPETTRTPETTVAPSETTVAPSETTVAPPETTRTPETTVAPPETTVAPPETTVAPPETTVAPPETTVAPPETTVAPPETTVAPPETTVAPPETTVAPPETTVAPPETTIAPPETTRTPETTVAPPETEEVPAPGGIGGIGGDQELERD